MQISILIAEDEERLRKIIGKYLINEGYSVREAENGLEALQLFAQENIDLIILDIMMPKLDGWQVLKKIRETSNVPVILLTARNSEEDTLFGFQLGTDDYVPKPFRTSELIARVKALLARSGKTKKSAIELFGKIKVDSLARSVFVDGVEVDLTAKEYELLWFFCSHPNQALSRDQILSAVWGYSYDGEDRSVDTVVKRLRQKLGEAGEQIETVRGMGYRMKPS